ncbi:MAG: biopolymer transporter ExbD [Alphaproteobacteria bacterium]|nr:biopolymer transporter ExbD [Alphaproteobacteria bacterium]
MEFARTRTRRREIGLIPLIDVAMFLLIFFMVAGTIEKFELLPVTPPHAASGKLVDEGHMVILMGTHEELVLDDELVTPEQLEKRVAEQIEANPNKVITLKADENIPAVRMIAVMDQLKRAGARNLSVATQSDKADAAH